MSLFLKIFLWFWLATALVVGAILLVNWSTSSEPLARQWQTFVGEALTNNGETSAQIYESDGIEGLREFFKRVEKRRRVNAAAFYDDKLGLLAGSEIAGTDEFIKTALESDKPEFKRNKEFMMAAKMVTGRDGGRYMILLQLRRFRAPSFFTTRLLLQVLAVILVGGLVCYGLALYLTSPIGKLSKAVQELAGGNFETRVSAEIGNRKDELASLAKDFDEMAMQIESLITSEKRLTQDISHELRSPLARMNVAIELARKKSNDETLPLLKRLETESQRLNELISQLLTLSKLETGAANFEKSELNLTRLVEELVADADFEAQSIERRVKLISADQAKIFGNEALIRSAIENVLRNASLYTGKESAVEVTLVTDGSKATIQIRDFGSGVPEEELAKLFKPFYRVSVARDRKSGGIGLGLAIAESAVSNHSGSIHAMNADPGLLLVIDIPLLS
jgi:two-component system sensor histidine kinase CpxA